jgi:hypothetical protein
MSSTTRPLGDGRTESLRKKPCNLIYGIHGVGTYHVITLTTCSAIQHEQSREDPARGVAFGGDKAAFFGGLRGRGVPAERHQEAAERHAGSRSSAAAVHSSTCLLLTHVDASTVVLQSHYRCGWPTCRMGHPRCASRFSTQHPRMKKAM